MLRTQVLSNGFDGLAALFFLSLTISGSNAHASDPFLFTNAFDFKKAGELTWTDFLVKLRDARTSGQSLSLGETHFAPEMILRLQWDLGRAYLEAPTPSNSKKDSNVNACFERIGGFFETPGFGSEDPDLKDFKEVGPQFLNYVRKNTASFQFREKNGPSNTDFLDCRDPSKTWLLYSGLMHQMKYALAFPGAFSTPPIQRAEGTVITGLFDQKSLLTVALYDLALLEERMSLQVIRNLPANPKGFRAEVTRVVNEMNAIRAEMRPITNDFYGLPLGREFMTKKAKNRIAKEYWPENSWTWLVDIKSRMTKYPAYPLLEALANLDDESLALFIDTQRKLGPLDRLEQKPGDPKPVNGFIYKKALFNMSYKAWEVLPFRMAPFKEAHEPQTEYLTWYSPNHTIFITAGPSSKTPSCTMYDSETGTMMPMPYLIGSKPAKAGFCGIF